MDVLNTDRIRTGERRKKRLSVIQRLKAFYCAPVDKEGTFPDAEFGLGDIPPEMLDQAEEILEILETIEWKWDINTILAQPDTLFRAVIKMMVAGGRLKKQLKDDEKGIDDGNIDR